MSEGIKRIDPEDCGCVDCILGDYSKPINQCTQEELAQMHFGLIQNASCCETKFNAQITYN